MIRMEKEIDNALEEMKKELKQCPHARAVKCIMDEECEGCEHYLEDKQTKDFEVKNENKN